MRRPAPGPRPGLCLGLCLGLFLGLFLLAGACQDDADRPLAIFGEKAGDCQPDSNCINADTSETEANSVPIIHRRIEGSPVVSARILFDGGARHWDSDRVHAEQLALTLASWWGSETLRGEAFAKKLASLGASYQASSGVDFAHASIVAPLAKFTQAYRVLADTVRLPIVDLVTKQGIGHVTGTYTSRFDSELDEPASAAQVTARSMLFGGHPYELRRETYQRAEGLNVGELGAAMRALRDRDRLLVVVVGDLSTEKVRQLVDGSLSDLDGLKGATETAPLPELQPVAERATILDYPEAPNWHVRGYFAAPAPFEEDYLPLLLGIEALSDLLFEELRTHSALVYTAGAGLSDLRKNSGTLWLSTVHPEDALGRMHELLREVQELPIPDDTFEAARAGYRTAFHASNDSASDISWTLANWQLTSGDRRLADEHLKDLDGVTAEDSRAALARYLPGLRLAAAGAGNPLTEAMLLGDGPDTPAP